MSADELRRNVVGLAAVDGAIDIGAIARVAGAAEEEVARTLFTEVVTELVDGAPRWVLRLESRRRVLATVARARGWIERAAPTIDPIAVLLRAWIAGTLTDLPQQVRKRPDDLRRVANWLVACVGVTPDPRRVLAVLALEDLRRRCDATASREFVGRKDELHWLDDAVDRDPRIAVLEGVGGAGKSALLAKWILRRKGYQPGGPIVMWVDFDDPGFHLARADRLNVELARQAAIQDPSFAEAEAKLREHSQLLSKDAARRDSSGDDPRDVDAGNDSLAAYLFARLDASNRQTLLVLDTIERPRNETPRRLDDRLAFLAREVGNCRNLRMVVAGRGPLALPTLAAPKRTLGPLPRDQSAKLLADLDVPDAVIHRVLDRLGESRTPLNLRLAARAVATLGPALLDEAALARAIRDARIGGFLQRRILDHLPSSRLAEVARYSMHLRTITPERLRRIVGVLIDPPIGDGIDEAKLLFESLEKIVDLVGRADSTTQALTLRDDIAGELRALALAEDPHRVVRLYECAIAQSTDPDDAEELAFHTAELVVAKRAVPITGSAHIILDDATITATAISGPELERRTANARELLAAGRDREATDAVRGYESAIADGALALDLAVAAQRAREWTAALALARRAAARAADGAALVLAHVLEADAMQRTFDASRDDAAGTQQAIKTALAAAKATLTTLPLADGSAIDRARALAIFAAHEPAWARDALRELFAARHWSSLSGADIDLVRQVCGLAETRESLDWAAELGAFDGNAMGKVDFAPLAAVLRQHELPSTAVLLGSSSVSIIAELAARRRTEQLGAVVRVLVDGLEDGHPAIHELAIVLRQLRGEAILRATSASVGISGGRPTLSTTDPAEKELRITGLAELLTPKFTVSSWRDLVDKLGDNRATRASVATDVGLAVRSTLVEIDRTRRGNAFAELLRRDGHSGAAALARVALSGDEDDTL